jgi:hypothetical protein
MCRWIFYYGEEVCIAKLIFGCTHGLASMSEAGRIHDAVPWSVHQRRDASPRAEEEEKRNFGEP